METLTQHSEALARSPQTVDDAACGSASARASDSRLPSLTLVPGRKLTFARPLRDDAPESSPEDWPENWQSGISRLTRWLDVDVAYLPQRPESGLRKVTAWAASAASAAKTPGAQGSVAPVFAPWRCWSPVSLQEPGNTPMPRADWIASYLYDHATGTQSNRGGVDIQLLSPLPESMTSGPEADDPMPRPRVLQAMIQTAQAQGRTKIAIVTDVRRRNAMIRQLLHMDRSITRDASQIEVLLIEDALCKVVKGQAVKGGHGWDAIIVLPDLRSLMFAMLAQVHQANGPWPMVWHNRGVAMICAEMLNESTGPIPFDGPLLVQTLALAASHAGLSLCAKRLIQGAARLWDCRIVTPGRGSLAPYVTEISDAEFIEELCKGVARGQRTSANWRAVAGDVATANAPKNSKTGGPVQLSVVGAG